MAKHRGVMPMLEATKTTDLPELPPGYEWEMVHQCPTDIHNLRTGGKWIVRISWKTRGGKHRMLNLKDCYFVTRALALSHGVRVAVEHATSQFHTRLCFGTRGQK